MSEYTEHLEDVARRWRRRVLELVGEHDASAAAPAHPGGRGGRGGRGGDRPAGGPVRGTESPMTALR